MFKNTLKKFFSNLKYVFTPLGTLFLGIVMAIAVFIPGLMNALKTLVSDITNTLSQAEIDLTELGSRLWLTISSLEWGNDPIGALFTVLNPEWLTNLINGTLEQLMSDYTVRKSEIEVAIAAAGESILNAFTLAVLWILFGIWLGYFITKLLLRRNMAKRAWWKYFLAEFVDSIFAATVFAFVTWLFTLWTASPAITFPLFMIVAYFTGLIKAYLLHGRGKIPFKQVVNFKNVLLQFAADLLVLAICVAFVFIVIAATNAAVGVFFALALLEIAFIGIGLNAESYVMDAVKKRTENVDGEPHDGDGQSERRESDAQPSEPTAENNRDNAVDACPEV